MRAAVLLLMASMATGACGADQWRELDARLNQAAEPARREGFAPLSGPYNQFGAALGDWRQAWRVPLDSGVAYLIGAACTDDCSGLGVAVGDSGAAPWLRFTPPRTDTFTVAVSGRCAEGARCRWIAQVYAHGVRGMRPGFAGGER